MKVWKTEGYGSDVRGVSEMLCICAVQYKCSVNHICCLKFLVATLKTVTVDNVTLNLVYPKYYCFKM